MLIYFNKLYKLRSGIAPFDGKPANYTLYLPQSAALSMYLAFAPNCIAFWKTTQFCNSQYTFSFRPFVIVINLLEE